jgi:hypothetical protein
MEVKRRWKSWATDIRPPFPRDWLIGEAWSSELWEDLAGIEIRRNGRGKTPQNFLKVIQVGPTG